MFFSTDDERLSVVDVIEALMAEAPEPVVEPVEAMLPAPREPAEEAEAALVNAQVDKGSLLRELHGLSRETG